MNNTTVKIFDSTLHKSNFSFLDEYNFKTPYFIGTILIGIYLLITQVTCSENPIIYGLFAIVGFYSIILILIKFFTKKVIKLKIDSNTITFTYRHMAKISEYTTPINSTSIQLFELKNHKSHFEGFEMNFKNHLEKQSFKLIEQNWSYLDFENIYSEFKKRKNEGIPENETGVFKKLQLMNNSINKTIA